MCVCVRVAEDDEKAETGEGKTGEEVGRMQSQTNSLSILVFPGART